MGAILSCLGYTLHQQPYPRSDWHVPQQLHYPSLVKLSPSITELYTRLGALEKNLQVSQAENTNKETVIQYLLQSSVSNARICEVTVKLKEQLLALTTKNDQTKKENEEVKAKLGRAEEIIFALSSPGVVSSTPQSTLTSFSSCGESPLELELLTEDLIDLSDYSPESDSANLTKKDTTLLEKFYEDESDIDAGCKGSTPDQSLNRSSDLEFEGSSYIVHFADADEEGKPFNRVVTKNPVELPEKINALAIEPRWTISKTFNSSQECESAASINRRNGAPDGLRYPDLFKYGIHFSPPDSERDVYRTIIVSNLSPDVSLGILLDRVRGGPVMDAKLLDTIQITGKKSALIIFLHEHAAMAFENYAKKTPVMISGVTAQVRVVSTPTWPIRIPLRKAIFDHHHTRCLEVYNFPEQISARRLRNDLMVCVEMYSDRITYMQKRKDGIVELQFSSVDWAGHAYGMLSSYRSYQTCTPYFAPDPCARPLESLQGQQMACTAVVEPVAKHAAAPDVEPAAVDQSGRLAKVEWGSDPDICRGRGFATGF